jgi:hypothetical protein
VCTVSIVPRAGGFRLVCNRDESVSRPAALPPVRRMSGRVPVWYPYDPQGGGTWVVANGHGLAVALLNRQQPPSPAVGAPGSARPSRGRIALMLAGAGHISAVRAAMTAIDQSRYAAFRLVAVANGEVAIVTSDGRRLRMEEARLETPIVLTSSSLSDGEAERRRRPLFDELVVRARDFLAGQEVFHDHRWPHCPEFSVRMRRSDARTVSRTVVDVAGRRVSLTYDPLPLEG